MSGKRKADAAAPPRTFAEWFSLGVSLLLLACVVGVILWLWASEPEGPPRFAVERGAARQEAGLFHLAVAVTNVGGLAAGQVRVEGRPAGTGPEGERPATTIEFLPVRAREEVVLVFRGDPAGAAVEVVSYQLP